MNVTNPEHLPPFVSAIFEWLAGQSLVPKLLLIMLLDLVSGTCLAFVKKTLSSTISWRGASKKVIMVLLVFVAQIIEPFAPVIEGVPPLPLSAIVAIFYIITEALSILENAAAAGVPLPTALVSALAKLRESNHDTEVRPIAKTAAATVRLEGELHVPADLPLTPPRV